MIDSVHENIESQKENSRTEINPERTTASVIFPDLHLTKVNPTTKEISVGFKKHPILIESGKSYDNKAVLIDSETQQMQEIAAEAEALKAIPEADRLGKVLELFQSHIKYAYPDRIKELAQTNPDLADWVIKNTGIDSPVGNEVPLSLIFEKGYAVCRHLSVAYLWLAQKAGLEGTLLSGTVGENILRIDTGKKLFQSVNVGEPLKDFHDWVEIKLKNGKWVPVDPSTNLVGSTRDSMQMFLAAKYSAEVAGNGFQMQVEPKELAPMTVTKAIFAPGQDFSEGKYKLLLQSTQGSISTKGRIPGTNIPYSGEGKVRFNTATEDKVMNLTIADVGITESLTQKAKIIGQKLNEYRKAISPEREFVLGVGVTGLYTIALLRPDILPENITEILNFLRKLNLITDWSMVGAGVAGLGIAVDGAKRIADEKVPLVKAFGSVLKQEISKKLQKK